MISLPPITMHRYNFYLRAEEPLNLPEFKGSLFRGAFGITFRRIVCITKQQSCTGCMLQQQCSYFKIFETEVQPNNLAFLKGVVKVPHPFVIMPPPESNRSYMKGSVLRVGLTLWGDTVNYFPFFVYTFKKMGETGISYKRSKVSLQWVTVVDECNNEVEVYNGEKGDLSLKYYPIAITTNVSDMPVPGSATLSFVTPVRLQVLSEVLYKHEQVTPGVLIDAIYRRYLSIAYLFCAATAESVNVPKQDYTGITITQNMLQFDSFDRYSNRQERKVPMGGFRGSITIAGDLSGIFPLLLAGERLHIGKNTVFGMGRYKLGIMNY